MIKQTTFIDQRLNLQSFNGHKYFFFWLDKIPENIEYLIHDILHLRWLYMLQYSCFYHSYLWLLWYIPYQSTYWRSLDPVLTDEFVDHFSRSQPQFYLCLIKNRKIMRMISSSFMKNRSFFSLWSKEHTYLQLFMIWSWRIGAISLSERWSKPP